MSIRDATLSHVGKRRVANFPIWGVGDVWIQSVTERERQFIESKWVRSGKIDDRARQENLAWWIRITVVTDESAVEHVFSDDDIQQLAELDSKVADSFREAINEHCACKTFGEAKKNSTATRPGFGPTE